ncbi:Hypothetical protein A7982_05102 [Minicystis rosea]|nr:Hypothetical protein A7982_05102 [Minicystis rosea]
MIDRSIRHRGLAFRLLEIACVSSLAAVALASAACSGDVYVEEINGTGGSTTSSGPGGTGGMGGTGGAFECPSTTGKAMTEVCVPPPPIGDGCAGWAAHWLPGVLSGALGVCNALSKPTECCDQPSLSDIDCGPTPSSSAETCCYLVVVEEHICG